MNSKIHEHIAALKRGAENDSPSWDFGYDTAIDDVLAILSLPTMYNGDDIDLASWDFMSVIEMDAPFPERRDHMKALIGRRDKQIIQACNLSIKKIPDLKQELECLVIGIESLIERCDYRTAMLQAIGRIEQALRQSRC